MNPPPIIARRGGPWLSDPDAREIAALISEGLCPQDRMRLVPNRLGVDACPTCGRSFWIRTNRDHGTIELGVVETYQAVTEADAVWPSPGTRPR